jgi:hypothetical protein
MQDLRVPIGAFFLILGGVLAATPTSGTMLTIAPVNFYTGAVSLVFGAVMVALSRRRRPR